MDDLTAMIIAVAIAFPLMVALAIPILHEAVLQAIEEAKRPPRHNCQCGPYTGQRYARAA